MGSSTLKKEGAEGEGNVKNIARNQVSKQGMMIVDRMGGQLLFCGNQFEIKAQGRLRRRLP